MTLEGRKATHLNSLKLGKPSPYAEEFADLILDKVEEVKEEIATEKAVKEPKKKKWGKK